MEVKNYISKSLLHNLFVHNAYLQIYLTIVDVSLC